MSLQNSSGISAALPEASQSFSRHFHRENLARLAFGGDLEGTATNFAVRVEPLLRQARVDHQLAILAAIRTLNISEFFHAAIYARPAKAQLLPANDDSKSQRQREKAPMENSVFRGFGFQHPSVFLEKLPGKAEGFPFGKLLKHREFAREIRRGMQKLRGAHERI